MSEDYLRQLELRWRETGDAPDEARFLVERMRAGLLGRPRLELAAFLGHEGARLALPGSPTIDSDDPTRLAEELWPWGKEACVAAAVSAVHAALNDDGDDRVLGSRDLRPQRAVEAAAAWVHCPCDTHLAAAREAANGALSAAGISGANAATPDRHLALAAHHAAAAAAAWPFPIASKHAFRAIKYACEATSRSPLLTPRELTAVICEALVPWALGPDHAPDRTADRNGEPEGGQDE